VIDLRSMWPAAYPLRVATTESITDCLREQWVSSEGVPDELLSDRGPNLISKAAMQFYKEMGVKKLQTSAYHPQANGSAEALVKKVKNVLKKTCRGMREWDRGLGSALMVLRDALRTSGGLSPYEL